MTFPLNEMYGYSRLCDRLRSSAIIWKQLSLRSSAIICDHMETFSHMPSCSRPFEAKTTYFYLIFITLILFLFTFFIFIISVFCQGSGGGYSRFQQVPFRFRVGSGRFRQVPAGSGRGPRLTYTLSRSDCCKAQMK